MILSRVHIKAFRSILELNVPLNPRINVLIGSNETGKTNILRAIESFSPNAQFDISLTCQYSNHYYEGRCPEVELEFTSLSAENRKELSALSKAFEEAQSFSVVKTGPTLQDYRVLIGGQLLEDINVRLVLDALPRLLYFEDIRLVKSEVNLASLQENKSGFTTERNLLKVAGLEDLSLAFEDSSRGRRAREEAGRALTEQVRRVWSQEPSIEVKLNVNRDVLYIDVTDDSTVFDTPQSRSLGFRWYLSFYVNFMAQSFEGRANEHIFLLEEPGIHLHPAGQKDLVKVIEDLSAKNQLIYTTHSPFMINRQHPERVLLVTKDKDGTHVDNQAYRQNWRPLRQSIGLMIGDLFFFEDSGLILELPRGKQGKGVLSRLRVWGAQPGN
ncbi:MAG: AAA family ATPase [bacterium]|jgi:predicted ATP-dependent endonuclease of OLD family|nr:AAA family ATPase [candidate division KSB1 bacterium]MDH7559740.1 AAA family ATPase [bacterium]